MKTKLKKGDLFYYGLLSQVWLVKKYKNRLVAFIVSDDGGRGHWEEIKDIEDSIKFPENQFELIGNIYVI